MFNNQSTQIGMQRDLRSIYQPTSPASDAIQIALERLEAVYSAMPLGRPQSSAAWGLPADQAVAVR